jgi:phosphopantothenoylcysteine decarboxylase/phosphopantothenate--cysteine ligase
MLKGKKIILGVTGSIAAYKAALLVRLLVREGAEVKVIMTSLAREFIAPLTMATLSRNPVMVEFFNPENGEWNNHVKLGLWADALVIAPATANTIAKMANGIADNLLCTTYLSARCPVFIVPAMDEDMYNHKATQRNIQNLQADGNIIIEAATGELASGLEGKGRMEEPEEIVRQLGKYIKSNTLKKKLSKRLINKKILVTAGPTIENIDPVRYISNYSSGKMGYALAEELANAGAIVTLISGPVSLSINHPDIEIINVVSADDMYRQAVKRFGGMHGAVLTAAVADYKPENVSQKKIRSSEKHLVIKLEPTIDIAGELGKKKKKGQFIVGFALEVENEIENASFKLRTKNFDFIILNSLKTKGAGFQHDTNKITIIDKDNKIADFKLKHKKDVARDIVERIAELIR